MSPKRSPLALNAASTDRRGHGRRVVSSAREARQPQPARHRSSGNLSPSHRDRDRAEPLSRPPCSGRNPRFSCPSPPRILWHETYQFECEAAHMLGDIVAPCWACTGELVKHAEPHGSDQVASATETHANCGRRSHYNQPRPNRADLTLHLLSSPINLRMPEILGILECVHSGSPADQHSMHCSMTFQ